MLEAVTVRCWASSATFLGPSLSRPVRSQLEVAKLLVASFSAGVALRPRLAGAVRSACRDRVWLLLPGLRK
jgi:hypothetical protein